MDTYTRHRFTAHPVAIGSAALALLYFWFMMSMQALPGQDALAPLGWWGWFDQSKTLESARALAMRDLNPARHWYPLGYSILGAPFIGQGFRAHPFAVVDLACLLVTFWAFVAVAAAVGFSRLVASVLFVVAVTWNPAIFGQWVIPWNSSPASALVWLVLALCARWLGGTGLGGTGLGGMRLTGPRHPVLLGLVAGAVPLFRPTESPAVAVCVAWVLAADWRAGALRRSHLIGIAAGAALVLAPGLALHLVIYGPHPSEYMVGSQRLGFSLHDFGWKAYVLLADPHWWFTEGAGLLRRIPWAALGLAGILPALVRSRAAGMVAAALSVHLVLYVSYIDLLPTGLWRFNNVHYWKWAVPGYALLAALLVRDLVRWRWAAPSLAAAASLVLAGGLSLVRVSPRAALADEPAKMLEFHGDPPGFEQAFFGTFTVRDRRGPMATVVDVRALPVPGGMRLIALRRPFEGPVSFEPGHGLPPELVASIPDRFVTAPELGRPCWMAAPLCGRRTTNPLLPWFPSR